jgi:uncharacterized membrane protein (UPF0127 family)
MVIRFLALLFLFCIPFGCGAQSKSLTATIPIGNEIFYVEIVNTNQTRAQGLMHRTEIPKDGGMLFVFPDSILRSFWMKNCLIPMDLIFLDSRGTITATHEMPIEDPQNEAESEWEYDNRLSHYWSNSPARFAIELQSGSIKRLGLKVNERIALDFPYLRSLAR